MAGNQLISRFETKDFWLKTLFTLLIFFAVLNALAGTVADPDLWGYMAFGRLFWEHQQFPYQDVFAYVPTLDPWVYHEWLTGVIFYPLYQALGATGLQLLKYGFGLATALVIYLTARERGADRVSAALGLWITQFFLSIGYSPVRAQVFTYLFFAVSLYLLERARLSGRWRGLGFIVVLMIPWCNLHGGFVAGLGLIGLYAGGEALSRRPFWPYLAVLLLSGLATLVNPYGLEYWTYLLRAVSMPRPEISEWASVLKAWQTGQPKEPTIYLMVLLVFSFFLIWWAKWKEITPGLVTALMLYLGLKHQRHLIFFFMVIGAYFPVLIMAYREVLKSRPGFLALGQRLGRAAPVLGLALLTLVFAYKFMSKSPLSLRIPPCPDKQDPSIILHYPVGAINYIQKNNLSGNLLSEFHWGEYLIWVLYPQCRVAMDGRYETVYADTLFDQYTDFIHGRKSWRDFLTHYPPDLVLIDSKSKARPLLLKEPGWQQVYEDGGCALFLRQDKPGGEDLQSLQSQKSPNRAGEGSSPLTSRKWD